MPSHTVFTCRRCGHCCQGEGGIVLTERDIERLCVHLGLDRNALLARYVETVGGMPRLVSGSDGSCVFYRDGCSVHPARPDVCRAWPFFRGNILDAASLAMAREDCPGIDPEASHEEFARQGKAYLRRHGLARKPGNGVPNALIVNVDDADDEPPGETEHGRPNRDAS